VQAFSFDDDPAILDTHEYPSRLDIAEQLDPRPQPSGYEPRYVNRWPKTVLVSGPSTLAARVRLAARFSAELSMGPVLAPMNTIPLARGLLGADHDFGDYTIIARCRSLRLLRAVHGNGAWRSSWSERYLQ
jgi:hypothetical protein